MDTRWAERFYTEAWTRKLRRWIRDNRGNFPNTDELVEDIRQEAVEKIWKQFLKGSTVEVTDALFLTVFKNALNDHYRKQTGHLRAPQSLIDAVGNEKLANDLYRRICLYGDSSEAAVENIRRLVEQEKRDYAFDPDLVVHGIEFIKSNGICKPPRTSISIDGEPADDGDSADKLAGELVEDEPLPEDEARARNIRDLVNVLVSNRKEQVAASYEDLHSQFVADEVIDNEQKIILRQYLSGEKLKDKEVGTAVNLPPHTLRRRRQQAFDNIRLWLAENGLSDILDE